MPQLEFENKIQFHIKEKLTRTTLNDALIGLSAAKVPDDADVDIITYHNGEGFIVKASWTKNVA